jgi:hypothetical protein
MKFCPFALRRATPAALWLAAGLACTPLWAARPVESAEAQAQYRQELAACNSGSSLQGRETCLYEAKSAHAQSQRGALDDGATDYLRNARQRCGALQGSDRAACSARMRGQGTTSGSAATGGIYRELTTRTVETQPALEADPL